MRRRSPSSTPPSRSPPGPGTVATRATAHSRSGPIAPRTLRAQRRSATRRARRLPTTPVRNERRPHSSGAGRLDGPEHLDLATQHGDRAVGRPLDRHERARADRSDDPAARTRAEAPGCLVGQDLDHPRPASPLSPTGRRRDSSATSTARPAPDPPRARARGAHTCVQRVRASTTPATARTRTGQRTATHRSPDPRRPALPEHRLGQRDSRPQRHDQPRQRRQRRPDQRARRRLTGHG